MSTSHLLLKSRSKMTCSVEMVCHFPVPSLKVRSYLADLSTFPPLNTLLKTQFITIVYISRQLQWLTIWATQLSQLNLMQHPLPTNSLNNCGLPPQLGPCVRANVL